MTRLLIILSEIENLLGFTCMFLLHHRENFLVSSFVALMCKDLEK